MGLLPAMGVLIPLFSAAKPIMWRMWRRAFGIIFKLTRDQQFLERLFPTVVRALEFVLRYQGPDGEIDWAVDPAGAPLGDALVTGCSSIHKSLECGILIADCLTQPTSAWRDARARLGRTLRGRPDRV